MTTGITDEKKKRSDKLSSARDFLVRMIKPFDCVDQLKPCLHHPSNKILCHVCQSEDPHAGHLKKSSSFGLIVPIISMVSTIDLD
jgi:hypothetical protein